MQYAKKSVPSSKLVPHNSFPSYFPHDVFRELFAENNEELKS